MQNLHRTTDCAISIDLCESDNELCLQDIHLEDVSNYSRATMMDIRPVVPLLLVTNDFTDKLS